MSPPPTQRPLLALALRIAAVTALATMLMLVKLAGESGVELPEIMFWRQAVTLPLILGFVLFNGGLARLRTERMASHCWRAATGMTGMLCNFAAAILLPLAVSTTLGFTTPLFAVLLTPLMLGEKVGPWRWAAVLIGFMGVLVIAQPGAAPISLVGAAFGLASGFMVAFISFQIRDLGRTEEPIRVVFYFALFGALMMAPTLPYNMTPHSPEQWLILLGIGLAGTAGQLLLTMSLRIGAVASVIVMDYTGLIWATLFGWAIWDQLPPWTTWLGAPLIVAAGLIVTWRERLHARQLSPSAAIEVD